MKKETVMKQIKGAKTMKKETVMKQIKEGVSFVVDLCEGTCTWHLYPVQIYKVPYRYRPHDDTWYIDLDDLLDRIIYTNNRVVTWSDVKAIWECDSHSDAIMWATALRFTRGLHNNNNYIDITVGKVNTSPIEYIEYLESIKGAAQ